MRAAAIATLALLLTSACMSARIPTRPRVRRNRIVSYAKPAAVIEIAPTFRYVGRFPFVIGDIAAGERIVFAVTEQKRVKRLFVAQFEEFLPSSSEIYRYSFDNAREIGGLRFRHNTGGYNVTRLGPGSEATAMHAFLKRKGYAVDDELLMSRFVTLGATDRRSELILFYLEPARDHGLTVDVLDEGNAKWQSVRKMLERRSTESFRVTSQ
jgi:hypothetical protein